MLTISFSCSSLAGWTSADKKTPDETIQIINHQGEALRGYVWLPSNYNPETEYRSVVMAHGCGGAHYKDSPEKWTAKYISGKYKVWGKQLNEQEVIVLLVDSFTTRDVNGDVGGGVCSTSYHLRPTKIDPISVRPADIAAGIHYLKQRSDIAADKVGVLGFSNGGTSVLALSNHESLDNRSFELLQQQKTWFDLPFLADYTANTIISLYPGCGMNGYEDATKNIFSDTFQTYTDTFIYAASNDTSLPEDTLEKCQALETLDDGHGDMNFIVTPDTNHQFDYYENNEAEVSATLSRIIRLFLNM